MATFRKPVHTQPSLTHQYYGHSKLQTPPTTTRRLSINCPCSQKVAPQRTLSMDKPQWKVPRLTSQQTRRGNTVISNGHHLKNCDTKQGSSVRSLEWMWGPLGPDTTGGAQLNATYYMNQSHVSFFHRVWLLGIVFETGLVYADGWS